MFVTAAAVPVSPRSWLRNSSALYTSYIMTMFPVDLNAILYRMEMNLASFHTLLKSPPATIQMYTKAAAARAAAIEALMWNSTTSQWNDYLWTEQRQLIRV